MSKTNRKNMWSNEAMEIENRKTATNREPSDLDVIANIATHTAIVFGLIAILAWVFGV